MSGILYVVATPIGNLEDITLRAISTLKLVDAVVAEDTRHSKKLLSHLGISKNLISYFEYSSHYKAEAIVEKLIQGFNLALISDAGTPTLSDPGARLVALSRKNNISVIPIPGPSALLAALSVSGLPTEPLHFWGFLSPKPSKRKRVYQQILTLEGVHGFYESCHKIEKRLEEWKEYLNGYFIFIGKELTKKFEQTWVGPMEQVYEDFKLSEVRGEYTVLVSQKSF